MRLKTTSQFERWDVYQAKVQQRLPPPVHAQHAPAQQRRTARSATIGQMAGVARTDWSWSALIADLDLDGNKDIFVTNGLARDVTSQDYVAFLGEREQTMRGRANGGAGKVDFMKLINADDVHAARRTTRSATTATWPFANEATAWGLDTPSFSSGAAYGDLDGDGALGPRGQQRQRGGVRLSQQRAHAGQGQPLSPGAARGRRERTASPSAHA